MTLTRASQAPFEAKSVAGSPRVEFGLCPILGRVRFDPRVVLARRLRVLPRRVFAVALHALFQGELTSLRRPRTYSQLAAVRNLGPPDPLVSRTADKYAVRAHVADRIGEEHLVPLLQVVYAARS